MTYEEIEKRLREKLEKVRLEYQKEFELMEEEIKGSGDIHSHVRIIPNTIFGGATSYTISIKSTSNMPKHIQERVKVIAESILSPLK